MIFHILNYIFDTKIVKVTTQIISYAFLFFWGG